MDDKPERCTCGECGGEFPADSLRIEQAIWKAIEDEGQQMVAETGKPVRHTALMEGLLSCLIRACTMHDEPNAVLKMAERTLKGIHLPDPIKVSVN